MQRPKCLYLGYMFEGLRVLVLLCSPLKPNWNVITIQIQQKKKKHLQVQEVSHFKQNHILAAVLCINHYLLNQWKAAFGPLPTFHPRSERKRTHTSLKQLRNSTTHITGDSHNPCGLVKWKVASDDVTRKRNKVGWRKAGKMTHTHTHTRSPTQCHHFLKKPHSHSRQTEMLTGLSGACLLSNPVGNAKNFQLTLCQICKDWSLFGHTASV